MILTQRLIPQKILIWYKIALQLKLKSSPILMEKDVIKKIHIYINGAIESFHGMILPHSMDLSGTHHMTALSHMVPTIQVSTPSQHGMLFSVLISRCMIITLLL